MWSPLSRGERGEGVPIVLWPVAIVALVAVAAIGWACFQEEGTKEVSVPETDLPPAHQIVEGDLKPLELSGGAVEGSADGESLVGHVTTTTVTGEEPIPKGSVTPNVPAGYGDLVPLAFHVDSATAGTLESGDWARLSFAPTTEAEDVEPLAVRALLLSVDEPETGETEYVVAVEERDRGRLLDVVARARLLVTPVTGP